MDQTQRTTAVGVFEDRGHAKIAVDELWPMAFPSIKLAT